MDITNYVYREVILMALPVVHYKHVLLCVKLCKIMLARGRSMAPAQHFIVYSTIDILH